MSDWSVLDDSTKAYVILFRVIDFERLKFLSMKKLQLISCLLINKLWSNPGQESLPNSEKPIDMPVLITLVESNCIHDNWHTTQHTNPVSGRVQASHIA